MTTLTAQPPLTRRDRDWRRHAKNAAWRLEDQTFTYQPGRARVLQAWEAAVGDQPGQVERFVHVSGRVLTHEQRIVVDHFVAVDCDGLQVGRAIRRAAPDAHPSQAWWPVERVRPFLTANGIPLTTATIGSHADLTARFPLIASQCDYTNQDPYPWWMAAAAYFVRD